MKKDVTVNPLFFLVAAIFYWSNSASMFFITYLALLFHEGIHLWFLCKDQIPVRKISLEPFGISIQTERKMPENAMVYLSAPIGNILVAGCFLFSYFWLDAPLYSQWILANLSLGLINLLPILPLDGGRALLLCFEKRMDQSVAKKRMQLFSILFSVPMFLFGSAVLLSTGKSFGMLTIAVFLCYTLLSGNRLYEYKKLKTTAFRTEKSNFHDAVAVEHIGVPWDYPAKKILKKFRGEKYYVVNVFRNGVLLKTVTETQILNRVLNTERNLNVSEC